METITGMSEIITGRCYCGKIRYQANEPTLYQANCHCENCRRAIGAQVVAWITVERQTFHFTSDEKPTHYVTDTGATRSFCQHCGSSLTYLPTDRDHVDIITASLDHPENYPPKTSVYADEKLPWSICDTQKGK